MSNKEENRVSLMVVWYTDPKELRNLAKFLERDHNISFTIRNKQLNVLMMLFKQEK